MIITLFNNYSMILLLSKGRYYDKLLFLYNILYYVLAALVDQLYNVFNLHKYNKICV